MKIDFRPLLLVVCLLGEGVVSAQHVGIGTTSPSTPLHVLTGTGYGIQHESGGVRLSTYIDANGGWLGTISNHPFNLYTNNGLAQFTLLPNGNIGVGTSIPQWRLDVKGRMRVRTGEVGNIFTTSGIWFEDYRDGSNRIFVGMQDSIRFGLYGEGSGGPGAGWGINFNARTGNVGIGAVAASGNKLEVAGNIKATTVVSNSFSYSTPRMFFLSVPPSAFIATRLTDGTPNNAATWYFEYENWVGTGVPGAEFVAPVILPDYATVVSMTIFYSDIESSADLKVTLRRRVHSANSFVTMCSLSSNGASGDGEASSNSIAFPQVNNINYNHSLIFSQELVGQEYPNFSNLRLKSVRIGYTLPGPN